MSYERLTDALGKGAQFTPLYKGVDSDPYAKLNTPIIYPHIELLKEIEYELEAFIEGQYWPNLHITLDKIKKYLEKN